MGPAAEERITWQTLAGLLALAAVIGAIAAPICVWVEPPQRSIVVRIAVAVFCGCALWQFTRAVAGAAGLDIVSAADEALHRSPPQAHPDPILPKLASEIHLGLGRRRFDQSLWARLRSLAERRGVVLPQDALPALRGRQMTEADLERVITAIEQAGRLG